MTKLERHLLRRIHMLETTIGAVLANLGEIQAADEWKYSVGHRDMELIEMDEQPIEELYSEDT